MKKMLPLINHVLLVSTMIVFLLTACTPSISPPVEVQNDESTASDIDPKETEPTTKPLQIEASVAESLPTFVFSIEKTGETSALEMGTEYIYQIDVSCPENPDLISQSFSIMSFEVLDETMISFVDIDFDGFLDMEVIRFGAGIANRTLEYYRWNPSKGTQYGLYEKIPFFSMLASEYSLYPDTQQIIATTRTNAALYEREMYQLTYIRNIYEPVLYELAGIESTDILSGENGDVYTVHVYHQGNEVYMEQMTTDEYYDISTERDNCLRYGVPQALSLEAAHKLLQDKLGTVATYEEDDIPNPHEYPLSYMFEKMTAVDGVSCYSFRMSWLVDNNHWSFLDDVLVTPGGTVLSSDKMPYFD